MRNVEIVRTLAEGSGLETKFAPYGMVFTFRAGKVVRWRNFPDQQSALEAAGLTAE